MAMAMVTASRHDEDGLDPAPVHAFGGRQILMHGKPQQGLPKPAQDREHERAAAVDPIEGRRW